MWAAGELASCRHYSQRQNGGNESFVNVYHQCGGVQLCLFDMKGKCGCKMLRLIATSPRRHIHLPLLAILPPPTSSSPVPISVVLFGVIDRSTVARHPPPLSHPLYPLSSSSSHLTPPLHSLWSPCPCNTPAELTRLVQSACALSL